MRSFRVTMTEDELLLARVALWEQTEQAKLEVVKRLCAAVRERLAAAVEVRVYDGGSLEEVAS